MESDQLSFAHCDSCVHCCLALLGVRTLSEISVRSDQSSNLCVSGSTMFFLLLCVWISVNFEKATCNGILAHTNSENISRHHVLPAVSVSSVALDHSESEGVLLLLSLVTNQTSAIIQEFFRALDKCKSGIWGTHARE